ncbi:MAG: hypothetical protein GXO16_04890, partial [Epsilonproteobacteria bacterium]|nr:hypothetical protein [Campylobacterota bacterium]
YRRIEGEFPFETAMLVHGAKDLNLSAMEGVDFFYATPLGGGNPWSSLSGYMEEMLRHIQDGFQKGLNKK